MIDMENKRILKFYLGMFDFRQAYSPQFKIKEDEIDVVEKHICSSFAMFVMKLNESSFKPIYLKIVDWAFSKNEQDSGANSFGRTLIVYKLVDVLVTQLKSIFVPFFGYILDNSVSVLRGSSDANNNQMTPAQHNKLLRAVLVCLQKCFSHDLEHWINKDRFDMLLDPLVSQFDFTSDEDYEQLTQQYLMPAITQLALCVGTEVCISHPA